uniref:Tumor necrosis factor receptor superfamily member 5 n=1 Tax=Monopterus albus TaxID=43700 RepID=A0A3Q3J9U3_MONAL|nr:tumor necrosis factor receptor superfamily member 11A [Monopterus albus]
MRLNFSTSWIFRGWITCVLITLYAQHVVSKSLKCNENQYLKSSRCCEKCQPGFRVFSDCSDSQQTKCVRCSRGEYQSDWTDEKRCLQQKFCDPVKGFMERPENLMAEEPCRCRPPLQCHPINCEFCESIPICNPGQGLRVDPESTNGRMDCFACTKGFFSAGNHEQCKPWTNCKAEGRSETQPGSAQADAVCGLPVSGAPPSWVIVSVLSVITVLCLLILLLFCYKDKLKLLSVNLRSCVQNLKRTRIQQETLAPLYHSGGPKCAPCETTKLICQSPRNPTDESSCTLPSSDPDIKVSLPFTGELTEKEGTNGKTVKEDQSEGSGEPEEVSEEEDVVSVPPLLAGSCVCVIPICEPLEVGENEDCSQAVSPGTPGTCSCRGLDGERGGDEGGKEKSESVRVDNGGEKGGGNQETMVLSKSETGCASLPPLPPPLFHISSAAPPSNPSPEVRLPLSQAQVTARLKNHLTDRSLVKQEELCSLASTDTTSTEDSTTSAMTSVSHLVASSSVGDLYMDKPLEASSPEKGQRLFWEDSSGNKLSSEESKLECSPESLHSQLAEPTVNSAQVSRNHSTTFISSGQVMNFNSDVVVVYVSQTSLGSDGAGQDDAFGSPVQEEAVETAPFFQSSLVSQGDFSHITSREEETLPVQEVMEEQPVGK